MKKMTQSNLEDAFAGESQAHMKYLIFADVSEKEGKTNIARLFRAIAYAEQVHATNHFKELKNVAKTPENLQAAIDGETFEVEEMYPAYNAVAELQEEKGAKRSINFALSAEKIHAKMYSDAKEKAKQGKDVEVDKIFICSICGYTTIDDLPERCPVCGAGKEKFKEF